MKNPYNISMVRKCAPGIRKSGIRSSEWLVLEQVALNTRGGEMRRLSASYIAKPLGMSRQWVNELLQRLEAAQLITRLKTGLIRLNLEIIKKIKPGVMKKQRRKSSKFMKRLKKLQRVSNTMHNKDISLKKEETLPAFTRVQSLSDLEKLNKADSFSPEAIARRKQRAQMGHT